MGWDMIARLLVTLAFLAPSYAFAAIITSKAVTGNLSTGANWVGEVAPVDGDSIVIVDGAAITLDQSITLGDGTNSVTVNAGGSLVQGVSTLTLNGAFTAKGDTAGKYSKITQNSGASIVAGAHNIILAGGTPNSTSGTIWEINGTSGARVINTSTTGKIDFPTNGRVGIKWDYAKFDGFLHATDCNRINGRVGVVGTFQGGQDAQHTLFKGGGTWVFGDANSQELDLTYHYEHNDYRNITLKTTNNPIGASPRPLIVYNLVMGAHANSPVIRNNTYHFPGSTGVVWIATQEAAISGNVSKDVWWRSTNGTLNTLDGNYFGAHTSQDYFYSSKPHTLTNSVFVSTYTNNHGIAPALGSAADKTTISYSIFYNYETQDNPVLLYDNAGDIDVVYNIFTGGDSYLTTYGDTLTFSGQPIAKCPTVNYFNNTVVFTSQRTTDNNTGSAIGIEGGQNYNYTKAKNNIIYNKTNYQTTGFSSYLASQRVDNIAEFGYNNFYAPLSTIQKYWGLDVSAWTVASTPTYASTTTFTVVGDQTATFVAGVRIRLHLGSRLKRCLVSSSSFAAGNTTVVIDQAFATAVLSGVDYSSGTNYQSSGTGIAGGGDLEVDPQFKHPDRNFITFAESMGGTGTIVQKITFLTTELLKINGTDADGNTATPPAWGISDILFYIKDAYTPTNTTLKTAGEGGTYIGAMDVVTLGNPAALLMVQ